MKTKSASRNAFFNLRVVVALSVFVVGVFLALFATANPQTLTRERARDVDARRVVPMRLRSRPPAAYRRHGLSATTDQEMTLTQPKPSPLTTQAMSM